MSELRDSRTGETISPESVTAQLAARGIVAAEEPVEEQVEVEASDSVAEEPVELSDDEQEAVKHGWKPDGVKSAAEFMRSEPLYEEIKKRGKELAEVKATLAELKAHMNSQKDLGYQEALRDLQSQRNQAIARGDIVGVDAVEQAIEQHKTGNLNPPVVTEFLSRNASWINEASGEAEEMRTLAHSLDQSIAAKKLSPEAHIAKVEESLKKLYPHRFETAEDTSLSVSPVESSAGREIPKKRSKTNFKMSDLNDVQRQCARHFERHGVMSVDKYIESLVANGSLK